MGMSNAERQRKFRQNRDKDANKTDISEQGERTIPERQKEWKKEEYS
jgi:hypothetical protein